MSYQLMTRSDCHLCEQAQYLLVDAGLSVGYGGDAEVQLVDIESNLQQIQRYGKRVPVLVNIEHKKELGWPFTLESLNLFLASARVEECE